MPGRDPKPAWALLCASWKLLFTSPDLSAEGHGEVLSPSWARLAVKPLQVSCQQLFQEHQALGAALPMGMCSGRQENKALKNTAGSLTLVFNFFINTWGADRDSEGQFSLLFLSKLVGIAPELVDEVVPGSRACLPGCSQAPTWAAADAENAPVQNKPSRGEILI